MWRLLGRVVYWLAWPALFVYLRRGARTRVLITSGDHILLVQGWMGDGQWNLPGGGLHRHEEPIVGAARETAEETGLQLRPAQLKPLGSGQCSKGGLTYYCHFFTTRLDTRPAVRRQLAEIVAVRWVPVDELGVVTHAPEVNRALELLAATR